MIRLLNKIGNKNQPKNIPLMVETYSISQNCFFNVIEKVKRDKGEIVYGWKLYQTSLLFEAERHAIWKSPLGQLIDISPDELNRSNTIFIEEDKGWVYKGEYTDNFRVNITNNPLVDDLILLCEFITKLYQTGERKSNYGISMIEPVIKLLSTLENEKFIRLKFINEGENLDSLCFCKSSMKYKDCHGRDLQNLYSMLMDKVQILINQ